MKTGIALIGFMGTGKTAVGRLLAERTGKEFIELDELIVRQAGKTIPELFRDEGETGFRQREMAAVETVTGRRNVVIACGGGVVLTTINIDRLRQECRIVCLTASPAVILRRTATGERPLLEGPDRENKIRALLAFRRPYYRRAADITVATSRFTIERVTEQIVEKLKGYESNRT